MLELDHALVHALERVERTRRRALRRVDHAVAAAPEGRDEVEGVAVDGRRDGVGEARQLQVEQDAGARGHHGAVQPRLDTRC